MASIERSEKENRYHFETFLSVKPDRKWEENKIASWACRGSVCIKCLFNWQVYNMRSARTESAWHWLVFCWVSWTTRVLLAVSWWKLTFKVSSVLISETGCMCIPGSHLCKWHYKGTTSDINLKIFVKTISSSPSPHPVPTETRRGTLRFLLPPPLMLERHHRHGQNLQAERVQPATWPW